MVAIVIEQNEWIQMQLMQYNNIHEGITNIDTWIEKNIDVPLELYMLEKFLFLTH
jgi:hypothetical protein